MANETRAKRRTQADKIEPRGLNKRSAARYLGCGESGIDELVRQGKLRQHRYVPNGRFYFDRQELDLVMETTVYETPTKAPVKQSHWGLLEASRGRK